MRPSLTLNFLLLAALFTPSAVFAQTLASPKNKPARSARSLPLTSFYDTPNPLPAGKPGELIRSETFNEYRLAYEVSSIRILYHSRSASGRDVAVSGVVLLPDGAPPPGGWPIIAWAHDVTGFARACAPSLLRNLGQGPLLSMYTNLGYAVVASDYAGLGSNFPYAALDLRSNAADVINAIPAARAAEPQLGTNWVTVGYAQGSLVAIAVAESISESADAHYLGAIGISGLADSRELFTGFSQSSAYTNLVFLAHGIKTLYPDFRIQDVFPEKAMRFYDFMGSSCEARLAPVPPAEDMLRPGWENNPYVKKFFARNALGQKPAQAPQMLISAEYDRETPPALTSGLVTRLCRQKDRVLFVKYPTYSSSTVLGNSVSEQVSWISARFSGLPAPGNCP